MFIQLRSTARYEAVQYTTSSALAWEDGTPIQLSPLAGSRDPLLMQTEGALTVRPTDWIVRDPKGELKVISHETYEAEYELSPFEHLIQCPAVMAAAETLAKRGIQPAELQEVYAAARRRRTPADGEEC
jgi:hypothetical protein